MNAFGVNFDVSMMLQMHLFVICWMDRFPPCMTLLLLRLVQQGFNITILESWASFEISGTGQTASQLNVTDTDTLEILSRVKVTQLSSECLASVVGS